MFLKINFDPIPKHTLFAPFPPSHTPAYHDTVLYEALETVDFFLKKNTHKKEEKLGKLCDLRLRIFTGVQFSYAAQAKAKNKMWDEDLREKTFIREMFPRSILSFGMTLLQAIWALRNCTRWCCVILQKIKFSAMSIPYVSSSTI